MVAATADLIPAHRFGHLLAEVRLASGCEPADLARLSYGQFTEQDLWTVERGSSRDLSEPVVRALALLYGVDFGLVIPRRAKLVLDIGAGRFDFGGSFHRIDQDDKSHILERYLSLVYMLRGTEAGQKIALRRHDLAVLGAALGERPELIEELLQAAMVANDPVLVGMLERLRKRLWVPGAGLMVGAVGLGVLVFAVQAGESNAVPTQLSSAGGGAPDAFVAAELTVDASPVAAFRDASPISPVAPVHHDHVYDEAVAMLGIDIVQTLPGWTVEVHGAVDRYRGLTFADEKRIEVFVRSDDSPETLAGVIAHEVGHALDITFLSDEQRIEWMNARGIETQWWVGDGLNDFAAGQGDFAEAFATYLVGDANDSVAAGPLTDQQLIMMEHLVNPYLRTM